MNGPLRRHELVVAERAQAQPEDLRENKFEFWFMDGRTIQGGSLGG